MLPKARNHTKQVRHRNVHISPWSSRLVEFNFSLPTGVNDLYHVNIICRAWLNLRGSPIIATIHGMNQERCLIIYTKRSNPKLVVLYVIYQSQDGIENELTISPFKFLPMLTPFFVAEVSSGYNITGHSHHSHALGAFSKHIDGVCSKIRCHSS